MTHLKKAFIFGLLLAAIAYLSYEYQSRHAPSDWDESEPPQSELRVLKRAIYYIQNNYVAPDRLDPPEILKSALQVLQQGLGPVMVRWNENDLEIEVKGQSRQFKVPEDLSLRQFPQFLGHIVDFVSQHLPEEDRKDQNMEYLLIGGIAAALDPHSTFLRPKIFSEFKIGTTGNFGGIGIAIGIRDAYLTVIAPIEGTPAFRAGLKAADRIIQINDERTINMSLTEAVERLRGKIGTKVRVLIRRENVDNLLSFTIRRALITIDSVKAELLPDSQIALVKVKNFQEDTGTELARALRLLERRSGKLEGIILDLRNNPGGLLDQAVALADAFLSDGIIVTTVGLNKQLHEEDRARKGDAFESIPVITLINEGSASASEILAGALQVHDRSLLIGNQTFGKGTVQTLYDLKDGSALKLTIAKYLAAGTEDVQSFGIVPDFQMRPIHITEKKVDLVANKTRREHDLEKRFENHEVAEKKEPRFKLRYLEEVEEKDKKNITGTVQLEHDYPVLLAKRLLSEKSGNTRSAQIKALEKTFSVIEQEQEERLVEALAEHDVDWSRGEKKGKPKADIAIHITLKEKEVHEIRGGQEIEIHVSVKNSGDAPFYRLLAVSESESRFLADLEFPFGTIPAGETKSYKVPISVPSAVPSQQIPFTLTFRELHDRIPEPVETPVSVRAAPEPFFVYSWRLKDPKDLKINHDIDLEFTIKNLGPGKSEEPVLNLANREGSHVFLKKGRATLEAMDPESEQTATLTIRFNKQEDLDGARLAIGIEDHKAGIALRDDLDFLKEGQSFDPPMQTVQRPPEIQVDLPKSPYWSSKKKYRFSGVATDDNQIKEIYVFVNLDKVFYQANQQAANGPTPFSVKVPLKPGPNQITVVAKDTDNLSTRKRWVVWKPE